MIIDNVFSDSQIEYLKELASTNIQKLGINTDPVRGRDDVFIGNEIRQDIIDTVISHFDDTYYLEHVTYSEYNNKVENPNLPRHMDGHYKNGSITFDYKLESSIDWPVCIEPDYFDLKPNQAIKFSPQEQWHSRPDIVFSDVDYYRIFFFYLSKK